MELLILKTNNDDRFRPHRLAALHATQQMSGQKNEQEAGISSN